MTRNPSGHVAIVGFMGAGKSRAARALGGVDTDALVEVAAGKTIPKIFSDEGEAVFRALEEEKVIAALRLSGGDTGVVEELLHPKPVRVDRERAWEALLRDKKGRLKLVLLEGYDVEVPAEDVRRELDRLIV